MACNTPSLGASVLPTHGSGPKGASKVNKNYEWIDHVIIYHHAKLNMIVDDDIHLFIFLIKIFYALLRVLPCDAMHGSTLKCGNT